MSLVLFPLTHSVVFSECKLRDSVDGQEVAIVKKNSVVRSKNIPGDYTFVISSAGVGYIFDKCLK